MMADTASRVKISRAASLTFKVLFAIAAVIAAGATYIAVTDTGPGSAGQPGLLWLLTANLVLIVGIGGVLGFRVFQLVRENRDTNGGARLRLRIILLFSLAAAIPTLIVAGFLAVAINRSVESWFSQPVYNIVDNARAAARASVDDLTTDVQSEVTAMATDFNSPNYVRAFEVDREVFARQLLEPQAQYREFARTAILDGDGTPLVQTTSDDAPAFRQFSEENWKAARDGVMATYIDKNEVSVLYKLDQYDNAFLYVARPIPPVLSARLAQANEDLASFRAAEARRQRLSAVLTLSYIQTALLMLLGTAWLGMTAAARIAMPIGRLAAAARAVRDGDLGVRMPRPKVRDEIDDLADAFNQMTERVSRQTQALDRARIDAESRSLFIEAVLAGVEAGVIRVDESLRVAIANASAEALLVFASRPEDELSLADIAPEFVQGARRAIDTGMSVETTIRRKSDAGLSHFHVRIAPEVDGGGAVITFHDTTRIVMGQRQAAWRDVARRIAHEIRNPLTPIQLSAERLKRRFASQITSDRETFERCTETITRQVADIGRMVEEFSGFARMPKPTIDEFDLGDVIRSIVFSQRMATPAISITANLPSGPLRQLGDERLLAQALTNVVKNAAAAVERHMAAGGVSSGSVSVDVESHSEELVIAIRDNGPGFPVTDRERVLEPYVTTRKNGVGLGLAIVTRTVEDHGGRIRLADNELSASGARVDICLPVQPRLAEEFVEYAGEGVA